MNKPRMKIEFIPIDITNDAEHQHGFEIPNAGGRLVTMNEIHVPNHNANDFLLRVTKCIDGHPAHFNSWLQHPKVSVMSRDVSKASISDSTPFSVSNKDKVFVKFVTAKGF